jgi:hypothetical protein
MNNILANLTTIKGFGNNHTPTEIQRRLLFACHFKQALASGEHFADQKRNKLKSLDEYYSIRAQMNSSSKIQPGSSREVTQKALLHRQKLWVLALVALLSFFWLSCIASILGVGPLIAYPLMPITVPLRVVTSVAATSSRICITCWTQLSKVFYRDRYIERMPFIQRTQFRHTRKSTSVVEDIAKQRAIRIMESVQLDVKHNFMEAGHVKLSVIEHASEYLYRISSIVDSSSNGMYNDNILPSSEHENASIIWTLTAQQGADEARTEEEGVIVKQVEADPDPKEQAELQARVFY